MEVRVPCLGLKTAFNTSTAQYKFERFCQTIMFPSLIVWFGKKLLKNLSWTAFTSYGLHSHISLIVVKARSSFLKHFLKDAS